MRVIAILASYNESLLISACLEHYFKNDVEVYLIDNESTDDTVDIARKYLNHGLIGIETLQRKDYSDLRARLMRKEQLAHELKADWFIHADIDEIRVPPKSGVTLSEALEEVDQKGYNAVNFFEYTFVPTLENPNHEHPNFQKTMKWYYPFCPDYPHRLNAWKRLKTPFSIKRFVYSFAKSGKLSVWKAQTMPVRLTIGGHRVKFNGIRMYPIDFKMKHYICLSREHAIRMYCNKKFNPSAVKNGWHGWRATAKEHNIALPAQNQLRYYVSDDELDASEPVTQHLIYKE